MAKKIKEKIQKHKLKKFKFPIDLIEFPIKYSNDLKVLKGKEKLLEFYLEGRYGPYYIDTPRKYKLMDIRTLLATLYFTDYHKDLSFEEKFTNWLNLLEVSDTGFYRKSILKGLNFLKTTTFYTPCIYDTEKETRNSVVSFREAIRKKEIPSYAVWGVLDSYIHLEDYEHRKCKIKVNLGKMFYDRIFKNKYFTLINFKKLLPLREIALNLYLFANRQDPKYIQNFPINFDTLKKHIGITTKHVTEARKLFEKAWQDIKDAGLLLNYKYDLKEKENLIWFYIQKSLKD